MGCDIHFVIEKRIEDQWVGVYSHSHTPHFMPEGEWILRHRHALRLSKDAERDDEASFEKQPDICYATDSYLRRPVFAGRNYDWFALLAGVRGDGPESRGVPDDISDLARIEIDSWGEDGHSHSWDNLAQFLRLWIQSLDGSEPEIAEIIAAFVQGGDSSSQVLRRLVDTWDPIEDFRVVYWFDN